MPLTVELITPEKVAFSDQVDFLAAPTVLGEVGILPGHAPLLTKLSGGDLRLTANGQTRHVAVTGGFLEVQKGNKIAIFAETADFAEEIDVERERLAAERARQQLSGRVKDLTAEELAQVQSTLNRAVVRLKVAGVRRSPPSSLH